MATQKNSLFSLRPCLKGAQPGERDREKKLTVEEIAGEIAGEIATIAVGVEKDDPVDVTITMRITEIIIRVIGDGIGVGIVAEVGTDEGRGNVMKVPRPLMKRRRSRRS